jgi:multiple sugar transport system permease protein
MLIAPTIIGLIVLNIYPFFNSIWLSLQKMQGLTPPKFIGIKNYQTLLSDKLVIQATWNTLYFMLLTVPVGVFLALVMATLLNNKIRGRDIYRGIYFLPLVVAPAAIAMVWRWMFNAENGIINQALGALGIVGPNWLSDPKTALAPARSSQSGARLATTWCCCSRGFSPSRRTTTKPARSTARELCASSSTSPCRWCRPRSFL